MGTGGDGPCTTPNPTVEARDEIRLFLAEGPWAVAGASSDRAKFGNKVLRAYLQVGREVYPLNPRETEVEGLRAFPDPAALCEHLGGPVGGLSIVTPPPVTEALVLQAAESGVRRLWMQPGAESPRAVALARELGLPCIAGGPCVLVALGFREEG